MQFTLMIDSLEQSRQDVARVAKLAIIGEMAASMAHEVRTPLGILRSSAQMLQREPCLSSVGLEMTDFILSETTRLNELITTLLACSRPRAPQFIKQDFHSIIEHCTELLQSQADERGVQLSLQLNAPTALLACDRDHCIQVLLNLIINALQHVQPLGRVQISTALQPPYLKICVSDDGVGISDDNKANVFDPFFTQRQEGIGLGLTVVQQIVLAHHGKIFVTDSDWGGAQFHVLLPISG
jgi:signal transduction histidine kinase